MIKTLLRVTIVEQDMLGLAPQINSPMMHVQFFARSFGDLGDDYRLKMFSDWFHNTLYSQVIGNSQWTVQHLAAAYRKGLKDAASDLNREPTELAPTMNMLHLASVQSELEGIMDATLQQTTRVVNSALLSKAKPRVLKRWLDTRLDKVAIARLTLLVNSKVIQVYNEAKLDYFKAAGLRKIGIDPEAILRNHHVHIGDRRGKRLPFPETVGVLTAGDNDVCDICEDISASGPYGIEVARDLIPAHPNCRCAFVPSDDERFAPIEDRNPKET